MVDGAFSKDLSYNPETWTAHRMSEFPARLEVLALGGNSTPEADGCTGVDSSRLPKDALVLLRRGGCALETKMENLARAGVKYTLIYNNGDGPAFDLEVRLDERQSQHVHHLETERRGKAAHQRPGPRRRYPQHVSSGKWRLRDSEREQHGRPVRGRRPRPAQRSAPVCADQAARQRSSHDGAATDFQRQNEPVLRVCRARGSRAPGW